MEINQSNQITHYHFKPASEPDEPFLYYGQFRGLQATNENTGCLYNVFPVTSGVVGGSGKVRHTMMSKTLQCGQDSTHFIKTL